MKNLIFRNCIYKCDNLIFFTINDAIPIKMNLKSGESSVLGINNRSSYRNIAFDLIIELNRKIYALEMSGKYMCEYCLDTHMIRYIQIDCNNKIDGNFSLLAAENSQILIFDRFYGLTLYDTQKEIIQKIAYPFGDYEVITGCKYKDFYYLFPQDGDTVFRFDVLSKNWETITLPQGWYHAIHAVEDNGNIYILTADGIIINWDTNAKMNIISVAKKFYKSEKAVSRLCITKNSFIVLPSLADDILLIDKLTFNINVVNNYPDDFKYVNNNWTKYAGYCETDDYYFFACRKSEYILKICKKTDEISWIRSWIKESDIFTYEISNKLVFEKENYLPMFLNRLCDIED